jgi:hypothetical protein
MIERNVNVLAASVAGNVSRTGGLGRWLVRLAHVSWALWIAAVVWAVVAVALGWSSLS